MADTERIISIDEALEEQTPKIQYDGELYEVVDNTIEDRLKLAHEFRERQQQIEGTAESLQDEDVDDEEADEQMDEALETLQDIMADAVTRALKDFPEEKARNLTEREFAAIMTAVQQARNREIEPEEKEIEKGKD